MEIQASDVIERLMQELSQMTQRAILAEARAHAAELHLNQIPQKETPEDAE